MLAAWFGSKRTAALERRIDELATRAEARSRESADAIERLGHRIEAGERGLAQYDRRHDDVDARLRGGNERSAGLDDRLRAEEERSAGRDDSLRELAARLDRLDEHVARLHRGAEEERDRAAELHGDRDRRIEELRLSLRRMERQHDADRERMAEAIAVLLARTPGPAGDQRKASS